VAFILVFHFHKKDKFVCIYVITQRVPHIGNVSQTVEKVLFLVFIIPFGAIPIFVNLMPYYGLFLSVSMSCPTVLFS